MALCFVKSACGLLRIEYSSLHLDSASVHARHSLLVNPAHLTRGGVRCALYVIRLYRAHRAWILSPVSHCNPRPPRLQYYLLPSISLSTPPGLPYRKRRPLASHLSSDHSINPTRRPPPFRHVLLPAQGLHPVASTELSHGTLQHICRLRTVHTSRHPH